MRLETHRMHRMTFLQKIVNLKKRKDFKECSGNHPTILYMYERTDERSLVNVSKINTVSHIRIFTITMQNSVGESRSTC